jgi:hypothetical protein
MFATAFCATLAACGGGNGNTPSLPPASVVTMGGPAITGGATDIDPTSATAPAAVSATSTETATTSSTVQGGTLSAGTATGLLPAGAAPAPATTTGVTFAYITPVQVTSTATAPQISTPFTFGQVFSPGDVKSTESIVVKTSSGASLPVQVDVKARHADGSVRHAIITAVLPSSMPTQIQTIYLAKGAATAASAGAAPSQLLNAGFTSSFNATIEGKVYSASADALLRAGAHTSWLAGPLVNEWLVSAPLKTASGEVHPHLSARFAIRAYGSSAARVDVTIENTWAFEAAPQNFTYDAQVLVGGKPVYTKAALTHYHHARWRETFWWGTAPQLDVRHNAAYLIATKAVPNYEMLTIKETTLDAMSKRWLASKNGPMESGIAQPYMMATGGRMDLGLLPRWNAMYLLSMDQRLKTVALGMSEQAGSWSSHYRNKVTGRPVTLAEYPYMTRLGTPGDTYNPITKLKEAFPDCPATKCTTPLAADQSHQPSFAYLPYLVTGDYYHLEELQFWANFNTFSSNPGYREAGKGLLKSDQVRGQGWSLRTLAQAAYITPDADPQKANFNNILNHNIDWYHANYSNNPDANKLGVLTNGYAVVYNSNTGLSPWQDDYFTAAVGVTVELGFSKAAPLLTWKTKFPVDRMTGNGYCWIFGGIYSLKVRDSSTLPFYTTIAQAYNNSVAATHLTQACASTAMATTLGMKVGQMTGYSDDPQGYPSYMQPALAYSVGANPGGAAAWKQFISRTVKPDYSTGPEFNVVPR